MLIIEGHEVTENDAVEVTTSTTPDIEPIVTADTTPPIEKPVSLDETIPDVMTDLITESEFVNDDNVDAFKLLNLKAKLNDINSMKDDINEQPAKLVTNSDDIDFIDKNIENVTEDEIKEMSPDDINKLLTDENGEIVEFNVDFSNAGIHAYDKFKKDFLIMRKQSLETIKKFDEELASINAEIAESQEEFDKLTNEFGNVTNLIRSTLNKRMEEADTDDKKELFNKMIISFDNGLNLDNIKTYCKSYKGQNIIGDYRDEKKTHYVYRRYLKVNESLNIKTDLTSFNMLENKFLPEEYQERPNIFVFAVIHYMSSMHNKNYSKIDGLFVTQFMINLKNLFFNKFDTEEDKEIFINNIKDVIKIIG